jgi:MerR family transcriptional regulator/heat shock protein HspR
LTRDLGVNLAGVEVILNMREQLDRLRQDLDQALDAVRREFAERRSDVARQHALVQVRGGALVKREP